ncbi:hypothetical protein L7F22_023421 [Adiantum nelumboides]|nr:hypothetical protein [Adiantum nelumboides]
MVLRDCSQQNPQSRAIYLQGCNLPQSQGMAMKGCSEPPSAPPYSLPSECLVADRLYIGDVKVAMRVLLNDQHAGVTHVLSLFRSTFLSSMCVDHPAGDLVETDKPTAAHFEIAERGLPLVRMVVPLLDSPNEDILGVMQPCFKFIDEGREKGNVLVHCMAGKSRSAAVVVAYLMRSMGWSLKQAMETLNRRYKKASPNEGYMRQLECLETQLRKSPDGIADQQQGRTTAL